MIYTPGRGHSATPKQWARPGGVSAVNTAAAHSSLLFLPRRQPGETVADIIDPLPGGLHRPPGAALAVMYARKWRLEVSIAGPGGDLSAQIESATSGAANKSWSDRYRGSSVTTFLFGELRQTIEDSINGTVILTPSQIAYNWEAETWYPGLQISVLSASAVELDTPAIKAAVNLGRPSAPGEESALVFRIAGVRMRMYRDPDVTQHAADITGEISLTPLEYLDVE